MGATIFQLFKFGSVGIVATGIHIAVWTIAIEFFVVAPVWANFPAFSFAVIFSFYGHKRWTFIEQAADIQNRINQPFIKFVFVSLFGLLLNSGVTYFIVDIKRMSYMYAGILMATAVPIATFSLNKFWVFRSIDNYDSEENRLNYRMVFWLFLLFFCLVGLVLIVNCYYSQSVYLKELFNIWQQLILNWT